jgi:hypothetical protein
MDNNRLRNTKSVHGYLPKIKEHHLTIELASKKWFCTRVRITTRQMRVEFRVGE